MSAIDLEALINTMFFRTLTAIFLLAFALMSPLGAGITYAQNGQEAAPAADNAQQASPAANSAEVVSLENPIEGGGSIQVVLGRLIKAALGLLGSFALFMVIDGGFTWLTSGGQQDRVRKGLMTMLYAAIGLFVIFAAYGILSALFTTLR